jgi:hypothetical protein
MRTVALREPEPELSCAAHCAAVRAYVFTVVFAISLVSCRAKESSTPPQLSNASTTGAFSSPRLEEASGLVTSSTAANVFWAQNDSGNDPELFAFDSSGTSLGVARVRGAENVDWEAIALGPCPRGSCVYIGDVGDNRARRQHVVIYRLPEPSAGDTVTAVADSIRVQYPDGPRDVEAMWVSADSTVWLLSKRPLFAPGGVLRQAQLYRIRADAWYTAATHVAELVDSLPVVPRASDDRTWITDASLSVPDSAGARRLAVRTYERVFIFATDPVTGRPGTLLNVCRIDTLRERQGEGVTWMRDSRLLFASEGAYAALHAGRCP